MQTQDIKKQYSFKCKCQATGTLVAAAEQEILWNIVSVLPDVCIGKQKPYRKGFCSEAQLVDTVGNVIGGVR